jgi:hypothetical protein
MGHAMMTKRFGGTVTTMGIVLLYLHLYLMLMQVIVGLSKQISPNISGIRWNQLNYLLLQLLEYLGK